MELDDISLDATFHSLIEGYNFELQQVYDDHLGHSDPGSKTPVQTFQPSVQTGHQLITTSVSPNVTGSFPQEHSSQGFTAYTPDQHVTGCDIMQYSTTDPTLIDTKPVIPFRNSSTRHSNAASEMAVSSCSEMSNPQTNPVTQSVQILQVDPNTTLAKLFGLKPGPIILRQNQQSILVQTEPTELSTVRQEVCTNDAPVTALPKHETNLNAEMLNYSNQLALQLPPGDCSMPSETPLPSELHTIMGDFSISTNEPQNRPIQAPSKPLAANESLPWKKYGRRRRVSRRTDNGPVVGSEEYKKHLDSLNTEERKKELNRQAAKRCRDNKFSHEIELEKKAKDLYRMRSNLLKEKKQLELKKNQIVALVTTVSNQ